MKLYEIATFWRHVDDLLAESEGEITPEIEEKMLRREEEFDVKVDSICALIREHQARSEAIDEELKRLARMGRSEENAINSLKSYLTHNLEAMGLERFQSSRFRGHLRSHVSIVWKGDHDQIPEGFRRITRIVEPDLKAAHEALNVVGGALPPGFEVYTRKSVVIR